MENKKERILDFVSSQNKRLINEVILNYVDKLRIAGERRKEFMDKFLKNIDIAYPVNPESSTIHRMISECIKETLKEVFGTMYDEFEIKFALLGDSAYFVGECRKFRIRADSDLMKNLFDKESQNRPLYIAVT